MANTSDGKGDPPEPTNTSINTDALSLSSPAVHSPKNDQVPTEIDQDLTYYSTTRPPVDYYHPDRSPTLNNNIRFSPDSAIGAPSNPHSAVHRAKNDSVSAEIDRVSTNYSNPGPPAPSVRSHRPEQPRSSTTMQPLTLTAPMPPSRLTPQLYTAPKTIQLRPQLT
mmetsp:Transcript_20891/g.46409  ORF Transcript_20891/g.46409 Transcript_20891/m.46409 type:complete len:166 (+) Transcript_20891:118-615(+)